MAAGRLAQPVVAIGRGQDLAQQGLHARGIVRGQGPPEAAGLVVQGPGRQGRARIDGCGRGKGLPGGLGTAQGVEGLAPDVGGPGLLAGIGVGEAVEQAQGGLPLPPFGQALGSQQHIARGIGVVAGFGALALILRLILAPVAVRRCRRTRTLSAQFPGQGIAGPGGPGPGREQREMAQEILALVRLAQVPGGHGRAQPDIRCQGLVRAGEPVGGQAQGFGGIARGRRAQHRQVQRVAAEEIGPGLGGQGGEDGSGLVRLAGQIQSQPLVVGDHIFQLADTAGQIGQPGGAGGRLVREDLGHALGQGLATLLRRVRGGRDRLLGGQARRRQIGRTGQGRVPGTGGHIPGGGAAVGGACGQEQNQSGDDYTNSIGKADESR